jgi:hypothetical protein
MLQSKGMADVAYAFSRIKSNGHLWTLCKLYKERRQLDKQFSRLRTLGLGERVRTLHQQSANIRGVQTARSSNPTCKLKPPRLCQRRTSYGRYPIGMITK